MQGQDLQVLAIVAEGEEYRLAIVTAPRDVMGYAGNDDARATGRIYIVRAGSGSSQINSSAPFCYLPPFAVPESA